METAKKNGVKAVLIVVDDIAKNIERFNHRINYSNLKLIEDLINAEESKYADCLYISKEMAQQIFGKNKIEKIKSKIFKKGKPISFTSEINIKISIIKNGSNIKTNNILAYIRGNEFPDEVIVVTAHYDHVGQDGDDIYNGADDDGSGTVALLELAEAFMFAKKEGNGPKRSLLFMPVAGEEKGLLGSKYRYDR